MVPAVLVAPAALDSQQSWSSPLTVAVVHGRLGSVIVRSTTGAAVRGALVTPSLWRSPAVLQPLSTYRVAVTVVDASGHVTSLQRIVRTSRAEHVLQATVSPDGGVYGVGQPVIVQFNRPVLGQAARHAVVRRLAVHSVPGVQGAWRWFSATEVHYRGRSFWPSGARVRVTAALGGLRLPHSDVWGAARPVRTGYLIDQAFIATVDVTAHVMTVTQGGRVVRVVKISTGRDKYPTKGGVHVVLARQAVQTFDSATVGIPRSSPDGYFEQLPWSVRISNGGAFVHANPATVGAQGRVNVSHGCVNTSVADAKWFYEHSHLGDVVTVVHAAIPPVTSDPGMFDWNGP